MADTGTSMIYSLCADERETNLDFLETHSSGSLSSASAILTIANDPDASLQGYTWKNFTMSMEMSFFAWNMEMSFFGMPIYILDMCPENQDESNGDSIIKLWLQFIPIFRALHSQLRKGHTTKKDISMFLIYIDSLQKGRR
jgi:hypothetical protein